MLVCALRLYLPLTLFRAQFLLMVLSDGTQVELDEATTLFLGLFDSARWRAASTAHPGLSLFSAVTAAATRLGRVPIVNSSVLVSSF